MPGFLSASVIVLLILLGIGILLYLPYARSPEKQWRDRVFHLLAMARRQAASERAALQQGTAHRQVEEQTLRDRAWIAFLDTITVDQLDEYPGIGPATLAKLRGAGYTTLAVLQHSPLHLPGLGAKRLADIDRAVRHLTRQCRGRFTAGGCPEGQELAERLKTLLSQSREREVQGRARLQAAEAFIAQWQSLAALAQAVTLRHYWRSARGTLIPAEVLAAPLPDLDHALAIEAQRASRADLAVILEIAPSVSPTPELVRRQYNLLSERYDPDKLQTLGPEFMELARSKRAAVQAAAQGLMEQLGAKLEEPAAPVRHDLRENPDLDAIFGG